MTENTIHQGRNIKRFREMLGVKQDALAMELGDDWNQQKVSNLEQREVIDSAILEEVAKILKVTPDAIKNFSDDAVFSLINNFHDNSTNHGPLNNYHCTFNPFDKMLEMVEENKKLYEALLKEKDEKIALLEKFAAGEKKKK